MLTRLDSFHLNGEKKINQDTLVGLAIIFVTMLNMFAWIIYFYYEIFDPFKDLKQFFA